MLLVGDVEGGKEINMAVCQPAPQREHQSLLQREVCPVSKAHYQKSKPKEGLKEGMQMVLHKGHTLVIKTHFIRPVLSPVPL